MYLFATSAQTAIPISKYLKGVWARSPVNKPPFTLVNISRQCESLPLALLPASLHWAFTLSFVVSLCDMSLSKPAEPIILNDGSQRGKPKLFCSGYGYRLRFEGKTSTAWICDVGSCKALLTSKSMPDGKIIVLNEGQHTNHAPKWELYKISTIHEICNLAWPCSCGISSWWDSGDRMKDTG